MATASARVMPRRNGPMPSRRSTARSTAIDRAHAHEGEEACHVLEGEIEIVYGAESHTLGPGDSVHWDGRIAHWLKNNGDVPAKLILARTQAGLMDMRFADEDSSQTPA